MIEQRREFLNRVGTVAITTPPVLALLLKAEGRHYALALSGGGAAGANPGNDRPVGNAGDFPRGQGPGGTGDRGNSR